MGQTYEARYYRTANDNSPVTDYLETLDPEHAAVFDERLETLEDDFPNVDVNISKKVKSSKFLRELRVYDAKNTRCLFCEFEEPERILLLLHAFEKKQDKLDKVDIQTAEKRREEWLKRHPLFTKEGRNKQAKEARKAAQRAQQKNVPRSSRRKK